MTKTAENGKTVKGTQVTLQKLPDPEPRGKRFPCLYYWLSGLTAGGVVLVVTVCTALVYKHRLEMLQSRVNALEEYCFDIETTMRNYVDERLRNILFQQVSKTFSTRFALGSLGQRFLTRDAFSSGVQRDTDIKCLQTRHSLLKLLHKLVY